jgi:hypothetical protein
MYYLVARGIPATLGRANAVALIESIAPKYKKPVEESCLFNSHGTRDVILHVYDGKKFLYLGEKEDIPDGFKVKEVTDDSYYSVFEAWKRSLDASA